MRQTQKQTKETARQQSAEIPHHGFGAIRIRAVAGATALKPRIRNPAEPKRDLPPLLRKDQFFD